MDLHTQNDPIPCYDHTVQKVWREDNLLEELAKTSESLESNPSLCK